jgi:hypothetical protein
MGEVMPRIDKLVKLLCGILLVIVIAGCGGGGSTGNAGNAGSTGNTGDASGSNSGTPPSITSVSPNPVPGADSAQPFTISGNDFLSGATVTLRDLTSGQIFANQAVSSFSSTQITVNGTFSTAPDNWSVEVINPGGASSGQYFFYVTAPVVTPTITSISPNPVPGSNSPQLFTIYGSGFVTGATVTLHDLTAGQDFANASITSATDTEIVVSQNFTTALHNWSVEVINPSGAKSGQTYFSVTTPSASLEITSVDPNPVPAASSPQTFTIYGSGFVSGATVTVRDVTAGQTFVNQSISSITDSQIVISQSFTTAQHQWSVEVINPSGATTGQYYFSVTSPSTAPAIDSVNPNPVTASSSSQTFTINGSGFVSGASVTLRDITAGQVYSNRPTSSLTSTQIVTSQIFSTGGHNWSVEVINPSGVSSGQYYFNVL